MRPGPDIRLVAHSKARRIGAGRQHHRHDRQAILAGEVQVALVMRRAAEDGARAVVHQHEVGDPDRQGPAGQKGMVDGEAGVMAALLRLLDGGLRRRAALAVLDEGGGLGVGLGRQRRERVVGGDGQEACAEQGVGTGGVDLQSLSEPFRRGVGKGELQTQAPGPADPVFLHQPHLVRPAVQGLQAAQQVVGVVGDPHEPLVQLAFLDLGARAPAPAVDHLLVGQDGHVDRVPVDHALLAVDQAPMPQVDEPGLLLAVIGDVAGGELPRPVDRQAQLLELGSHGVDVLVGPGPRIDPPLHGGVLRRQAERIPAHGMQHVEAPRPLEPGDDVAQRIVSDMAHVQLP